ncbi:MAG TPA: protein-L-isoaspartate(D-aspartate) O-methyltransferase [Acidiferrobacteraceae bacterium]|nr:protein-L-isoaspartate(D-aspartate) O-methyltransferase [Acidiferrobacteraceae bacterium]HEX20672.1 protein-L-isoaspartate(D-aspartate) O-methyltransferase [Acidiferrobacteraceae bacterium]
MKVVFSLMVIALVIGTGHAWAGKNYAQARKALVLEIEADVRYTRHYLDKAELDPRVMAAIGKVPRHEFVPKSSLGEAYENRPLAIGYGQTISQPYIVALMTDLIQPKKHHRVLEVGTGSGYQAAVLSELVARVYTIEIIEPLGRQARDRLKRLKYNNITMRIGDGYYGWKQHGPFDAIVVTAAASHIPPPLIRQLKPGGRMIIPVGSRFLVQQLLLVSKDAKGKVTTRQIIPVKFVPLTGKH